jgi:hypothetical protein
MATAKPGLGNREEERGKRKEGRGKREEGRSIHG